MYKNNPFESTFPSVNAETFVVRDMLTAGQTTNNLTILGMLGIMDDKLVQINPGSTELEGRKYILQLCTGTSNSPTGLSIKATELIDASKGSASYTTGTAAVRQTNTLTFVNGSSAGNYDVNKSNFLLIKTFVKSPMGTEGDGAISYALSSNIGETLAAFLTRFANTANTAIGNRYTPSYVSFASTATTLVLTAKYDDLSFDVNLVNSTVRPSIALTIAPVFSKGSFARVANLEIRGNIMDGNTSYRGTPEGYSREEMGSPERIAQPGVLYTVFTIQVPVNFFNGYPLGGGKNKTVIVAIPNTLTEPIAMLKEIYGLV